MTLLDECKTQSNLMKNVHAKEIIMITQIELWLKFVMLTLQLIVLFFVFLDICYAMGWLFCSDSILNFNCAQAKKCLYTLISIGLAAASKRKQIPVTFIPFYLLVAPTRKYSVERTK